MILIVGVILIGILLILLEILILPGMIAGIIGALLVFFGIYQSYAEYGSATGNITLATTVVVTLVAIYYSFKSGAWNRFGLKNTIEGKVNDVTALSFNIGDEGSTLSALRPSGTILINGVKVEAQSQGDMIDAGTKVIVSKVLPNKLIVKIKVTDLV